MNNHVSNLNLFVQFISAIESPLKAAGYNVQVVGVSAVAGSIVVTSTTEFLDGSTTGASDFEAALKDSASVAALFPASVYGAASVESVTTASVTNPSELSSHLVCEKFKRYRFTCDCSCRWSRSCWVECCNCGHFSVGLWGICFLNI